MLTDPAKNISFILPGRKLRTTGHRHLRPRSLTIGTLNFKFAYTWTYFRGICLVGEGVCFTGIHYLPVLLDTDLEGGFSTMLKLLNELFVLDEETVVYPGHSSDYHCMKKD